MAALQLSREERALYNPAFTAVLCTRAVHGHDKGYTTPCPLPVAVTAAIMALQPSIRAELPATTGASLMGWIEQNDAVRIAMGRNTSALATVVRPGLLFALQSGILRCDSDGLTPIPRALPKIVRGDTEQSTAIQQAAFQLGRWLPSAGSLSTVLTLLGVKP
ncbi:three component ABC system middle component [Nocardiopsis quinghaiensis]|uniref:three component ABC system middle component n=1 Tax=Nocardiopsis quinghaiensis TaxID=464995 RepID=UPI00123AE83E|nr:three component ABC system middle component [Nocardiopsis quinghaiensis]